MKQLIVTADDVGLHESIDTAALRAHREGIVTAWSIVASGAAFEHAIDLLRSAPAVSAGVHLTFVEERSVLSRQAIPTLVDRSGQFPQNYRRFTFRLATRRIALEQLERELRAQIEKVFAAGVQIDHLNGHQHLHLLPHVFGLTLRLAAEYRIPYVRIVDDRGGRGSLFRTPQIALLNALGRRARRMAPPAVMTNDHTIGVVEAGRLDGDSLRRLVARVEGVTELVCHPGEDDDALSRVYRWKYRWARETAALCEPGLPDLLVEEGIELISHRVLSRRASV